MGLELLYSLLHIFIVIITFVVGIKHEYVNLFLIRKKRIVQANTGANYIDFQQ